MQNDLINGRTPEEIKLALKVCNEDDCLPCPYEMSYICSDYMMRDALALIEHLEAKLPKWISVEERLPEADKYVLAVVKNYGYGDTYSDVAMYDGELWVRDAGPYFDIIDKGEVTHWMPMHELPKGE